MVQKYKDIYIKTYWDYYLLLEERLIKTVNFVAFDEVNNKTYSIEYLALLQTICSEIDVVGKEISYYFNPTFDGDNIKKWGYYVQRSLSGIESQRVIFNHERTIIPWSKWTIEERTNKKNQKYLSYADGCGSPNWWKAYTDVKHARTSLDDGRVNYHKANQKNVIDALAALFLINRLMMIHLDEECYALVKRSELFVIPERNDEMRTSFVVNADGKPCLVCSVENGKDLV